MGIKKPIMPMRAAKQMNHAENSHIHHRSIAEMCSPEFWGSTE
jgi:hypothetical protein